MLALRKIYWKFKRTIEEIW